MIYSMTGYGKAVTQFQNRKICAEIRSLNGKSMDLTLLDKLQRATGEKYSCRLQSNLKPILGNEFSLRQSGTLRSHSPRLPFLCRCNVPSREGNHQFHQTGLPWWHPVRNRRKAVSAATSKVLS